MSTRSNAWALLVIAALVFAFNSVDIFLIKTMYVDDNHRYILGLENQLHATILERNPLRAYLIFPLYKLMSIDLVYARLSQVLLFYIPLSFSFFIIYKKYAKLPNVVAITASALPCFLPGQDMIPSFIDGSYTIQGLLAFNISMLFALRQLNNEHYSFTYICMALLFYVASLELMDQAVFLFPFMVLLVFIYKKRSPASSMLVLIALVYILPAAVKTYQIVEYPTVPASVPITPTWETINYRFREYIPDTLPMKSPLLFLIIISIGSYLSKKNERTIIILGLAWAFLTAVSFIVISRYYSSRYAHISAFGMNLSLIVSIYAIFSHILGSTHKTKRVTSIVLVTILLYSGVARSIKIYKLNHSRNVAHDAIHITLTTKPLPANSQIVILNAGRIPTGGWWIYSSGYLKYATDRLDITGLVGPELSSYDPFNEANRGFSKESRMSGLDLNKPLFIYRLHCATECSLTTIEYSLQVKDDKWHLIKMDKASGTASIIATTHNYEKLIEKLERIGLTISNVAFAPKENTASTF